MSLDRRFISGFVVLACLAYTPAAIGYNPLPPFHPKSHKSAGTSNNNKNGPDLPAEGPCDLDRLAARQKGYEDQERAMVQEMTRVRSEYQEAERSGASDATLAAINAQAEDLQRRYKPLDDRLVLVENQIAACQGELGDPSPIAKPAGGDGPSSPDGGGGPPPPGSNGNPALVDKPKLGPGGDRKVEMRISCRVPKGPQTTSVLFRNIGKNLIPSGTPVTWYVKTGNQGGKFSLPHDLVAGAELTAADLLKLGVPGSTVCRSKL